MCSEIDYSLRWYTLHSGMLGCVYRVIVSMYESVKSIVRLGSEVSDVIQQHVGLRQGCVLRAVLL